MPKVKRLTKKQRGFLKDYEVTGMYAEDNHIMLELKNGAHQKL